MEKFKTLPDALSDLRERGYNADFSIETFCLYCGDLDVRLNPEQYRVDEEYRFTEDAHEEDTVVAAITSSNGIKGVLVDSYGSYSGNEGLDLTRQNG